jgi:hypothetical protein
MQSITFAVPTLATAAMSRQDQIDLVANQAAAAIICCYLEHMNAVIAVQSPTGAIGGPTAFQQVLSPAELVALINDVQAALRTIT